MFSTFTIVFAFAAGRASVEQKLTHVELSQTKVAMRPPPLRASDANVASTSMATVPLPPVREMGLWAVYESILKTRTFVDLTHSFDPAIPHWKGFQPETVSTLYNYDADGFWAQQFCHVGQWGTHLDPPAHFVKGKRTIDQIRPDEMLLPLVVIDVHDKVAANPDYTLSMSDIRAWETKHAQAVPEGAFVAMRTDWSKRWPDGAAMDNKDDDGVPHYPGWSIEVLRYLYEERKITASGHETTDTDPGVAVAKDDYSLETYILAQDRYQVELLSNLDKVPPIGALVVISFPKPKGASGFPARVFAILP
jgi:kynurenine formamidase